MKALTRIFDKFRTIRLEKLKAWTLLILFTASFVLIQTLGNAAEIPPLYEASQYEELCHPEYQLVKLDIYPVLCINLSKEGFSEEEKLERLEAIQNDLKNFADDKALDLEYLEAYDEYPEYDLKPYSINSIESLPSAGRDLIAVGKMKKKENEAEISYHARIFDGKENIIFGKTQTEFSPSNDLKKKLDEAFEENDQTDDERRFLIQEIISSLAVEKRIRVGYGNQGYSLKTLRKNFVASLAYREVGITANSTQKDFENIESTLLEKVKGAIRRYRESSCINSSQTVKINWQNDDSFLTLFCVKSTVKDDESVGSRAARINQKLEEILRGEINVETLGIVNFSNLREKESYDIGDEEAYAIVGYGSYSETPEIILLVTESDVKISASSTDNDISKTEANDSSRIGNLISKALTEANNFSEVDSLTSKAIGDIFSKIVKAVDIYEEQKDAAVRINFGAFRVPLFKCLFLRPWTEEIYPKADLGAEETRGRTTIIKIFLVKGKGSHYNRNYRAVEIGNKISELADSKPLPLTPHNLNLFYTEKDKSILQKIDNDEVENPKPFLKNISRTLGDYSSNKYYPLTEKTENKPNLDDIKAIILPNNTASEKYIVIAAGDKPNLDDIVMTILPNDEVENAKPFLENISRTLGGYSSNKYYPLTEDESSLDNIKAVIPPNNSAAGALDNKASEKELAKARLFLRKIRNVLEVYRANKYLSFEILVVCLTRFIYHISFNNNTKKEKERNIIFIICSVAILLHITLPFVLFRTTPKLVFLSSTWLIILALIIMFTVSELYQPRKQKNYIEKSGTDSSKKSIKYYALKLLVSIVSLRDWVYVSLFLMSTYVLFDIYLFKQSLSMNTLLGFEAADRYFKDQFPKLLSIWLLGFLGVYLIGLLILWFDIIFLKKDLKARKKIKWNYFIYKRDASTHPEAIICMLAILAFLFMLAMSAPYFPGAGTPYFTGVSAIAGLIFTWSASASIADFISGIILIFVTNVEEGDWVKIGNVEGKLKDQNLLVHHIKTPKNTLVTIPNAKVLRDIIINYTSSRRMTSEDKISENIAILHTNVTLGYDISPVKVREALKKAAEETNDVITPEKIDAMTPFKSRLAGYELKVLPVRNIAELPSKGRKLMIIGKIENPYYDYDLKLMNLEHTDKLPQKGRSLVILAKIQDFYHARVFDATEKIVIDEGRDKFLPSKELLQELDADLISQSISKHKKSEIIRKAASSLSHVQYYYAHIVNSIGKVIFDRKNELFSLSKALIRKLDKVQELLDELAKKPINNNRKQDKLERVTNEIKQEIMSELIRGLNLRIEYVNSRIHGIKIYIEEVESWLRHKKRDSQLNKIPIIWLLLREYNCLAGIIFLCDSQSFLREFPNNPKVGFILLQNLGSRLRSFERELNVLKLRLRNLESHRRSLVDLNSELSLELRYHFEKSNLSFDDLKDLSEEDKRHLYSLYSGFKKNKDTLNIKPFVLVKSLDDFYVSYELNALLNPSVCFVKPELIPRIYSKLHEKIHQVCSEKGIEILSPHYEASREGNAPAVPDPCEFDVME